MKDCEISSIIVIIIVSAAVFLAVLSISISFSFRILQPNGRLSHAFGQTQTKGEYGGNTSNKISLSHLTSQGSPYQCHLCARYVKNTEPKINETYIQTGKVALVYKHLPNSGFDSVPTALAAQCKHDQGKFWQFHNLPSERQGPIDSGWAN
jgi:hypothetical protein